MKNLVVTDKDISNQLFKNPVIVNLNNINYSSCTGGLECLKCEGACYFKDDMSIISKWMNDCQLIVYILLELNMDVLMCHLKKCWNVWS